MILRPSVIRAHAISSGGALYTPFCSLVPATVLCWVLCLQPTTLSGIVRGFAACKHLLDVPVPHCLLTIDDLFSMAGKESISSM